MKTTLLFLGLFIALLLTGCGRSKLETENQQLKQQLDSMTKKAGKVESDLKAALLKIETQNHDLEDLTNRISDYQKSKDKMEKDLEMYRGKAKEAIEDIKALDGILDEQNLDTATYAQNYISTKMEVSKLVSPMSQSEIGKRIVSLISDCDDIKNTLEDTDSQLKQTEESENEAFRSEAALANGKYEIEDIRFEHSTNLLEKIKDIKINQAGMILKIRTKLALDIFNVETLMK